LLYIYVTGNYARKKQGGKTMYDQEKYDDVVKLRDLVQKAAQNGIGSNEDTDVYRIFGYLNHDKIIGILYGLNKALGMLL